MALLERTRNNFMERNPSAADGSWSESLYALQTRNRPLGLTLFSDP